MKILQVHNKYLQSGGEDFMLQAERIMLEKEGHEVIQYIRDNAEVSSFNTFKKIMLPFSTIFSLKAYFEIKRLITKELPDIVHFHNTFPLVSPSAYFACLHKKVPFVQRIPNYRFICPNALMLRNQKICNLCVKKKNPFYAVKYSCYRDSKLQSFIIALQLFLYGRFFRKHVQYIPNSPIVKELFLEAGFKDERLSIKSNLTDTIDKPIYKKDSFAIYVGRLSKEKGIATLAKAWKHVDFKLEVFGSGPVEDLLNKNKNIILHGHVSKEVYIKRIKQAQFLIFPSEWDETFGIAMLEAMSVGTPLLTSDVGNMKYLNIQNKTGRFFKMGDAKDLAKQATWMFNHKKECEEMGRNAYAEYKEKYTAETNYKQLMEIYNKAIEEDKQ